MSEKPVIPEVAKMVEKEKNEEPKIKVVYGQEPKFVFVATYKGAEVVLRMPTNMTHIDAYSCTREILLTIKKLHETNQKQLAEQKKAAEQMEASNIPENVES